MSMPPENVPTLNVGSPRSSCEAGGKRAAPAPPPRAPACRSRCAQLGHRAVRRLALGGGAIPQDALVRDVRDAGGRLGHQHRARLAQRALGMRQRALAAGLLGRRTARARARARRARGHPLRGHHDRRHAALHVARPAAVEPSRRSRLPNGLEAPRARPSGTVSRCAVMHSAGPSPASRATGPAHAQGPARGTTPRASRLQAPADQPAAAAASPPGPLIVSVGPAPG